MTRRLTLAPLLAAGFAALVISAPAHANPHAQDELGIDHVEASDGRVSLVLAVDDLPTDANADPSSVAVEVDGRTVDATTKVVAAGDIDRSTILVLDTSLSMRGAKFAAATSAVNAFLDAAPPDVAIGLVTFAGSVQQSIAPTTNHDTIRTALLGIKLSRGTSVYDAALTAVEALGTDGSRALLVLSDGADTGSSTTLDVAAGAAKDAGAIVDVVSIGRSGKASNLAGMATDTGGKVIPADAAALSSVFTAQADALAHQLLVAFDVPDGVGEEASVNVTLLADGVSYSDSAFVNLGASEPGLPDMVDQGKALVSTPLMLLGAVAIFIGLGGLLTVVMTGPGAGRSAAERRLDSYFAAADGKQATRRRARADSGAFRESAVAVTSKFVHGDFETRISQRLAGAGSALTAAEWLLLHAAIAVGALAVGFVLSGAAAGGIGFLLGVVLPWLYLKWRHRRRLRVFNGQLAETLGLMAGGLQAGLSLPQAVDTVVQQGSEPIKSEFRRALVEQRLGIEISDALDGVGQRMESEDFGWVVMAIRIQREVGGNLAEILHTVAETLREREFLRRQVKALSAEGRLSGYILTGLPPSLGVYMYFANREYVSILWTTGLGWIMLAAAATLLGVGSWAMSKLAKVEV